jgi:catechol 2,3-dioxygenase-like lactoylglutathione lyase family enzyme
VSVERIEHFLLLSDDIDATRDFYCRALGLSTGERPPLAFPGYWLYANGRPLVHIADRGRYGAHAASIGLDVPASGGAAMRIDHIAFTATDYVEAAERLERGGIAATRNAVPAAGLRQLFFADPDGVRIEVNVFDPDVTSHTDERE